METKKAPMLHLKQGSFPVIDLPRRSTYFLCFDMLLVFTFGAGWAVSFAYSYDTLLDNPLIRVAGFNPITVGINHFPARIISNITWGIMLFPLTMYFIANLFHFSFCGMSGGMVKCMIAAQVIAYACIMGFGLLLGFEPKFHPEEFTGLSEKEILKTASFQADVFQINCHLAGFVSFLFGLSVTRCLEVICYIWDPENRGIKWPKGGNLYLALQTIYILLCFGAMYVPIWMMIHVQDHLLESLHDDATTGFKFKWFSFEAQLSYGWRVLMIIIPVLSWWASFTQKRGPAFCVTKISKPKPEKYYP